MAGRRTRAGLTAGALLVVALPLTASAVAPPLTCGPKLTGRWEQIPVRPFQPVSGLASTDRVSAYTVDTTQPYDVAVTNGGRVQLSHSHGCDWSDGYALDPVASQRQPFVGQASAIVSLGLLRGTVLAAVQEGTGSGSRPHVLRYAAGTWSVSDSGLPAAGAPRLLRAAGDGRTAYLTISPTDSGGSDTGNGGPLPVLPPLPTIPGVPVAGATGDGSPTGLLYATTDAGATWSLRTGADQLPGGGAGFSSLVVDPHNARSLFGIVSGKVLLSSDGGASFTTLEGSGYTAVTPVFYGGFAAFDAVGHGVIGFGNRIFLRFPAPRGITSAAYREGDSALLVESHGVLRRVEPSGAVSDVPAASPARAGTLLGDVGTQSSFHALSGHDLLRYVDPLPPHVDIPQVAIGDDSVSPPKPGVVTPSSRTVSLPVGRSATESFTLDLPKNPTPLDLFFLIDVSTSMSGYIDNLKQNLHKVVERLTAAHVDLRVGVGTLGTAPAPGEAPYPDSYVYPPVVDPTTGKVYPGPTYRKPRIYQLIRHIDSTGPGLDRAINSVQLETDPPAQTCSSYHEGQLLALEQMVTGSGVRSEQDDQGHLPTYSAVAPGQDAQWRGNPGVRRIVVLASDEAFDAPYGTPTKRGSTCQSPILDFTRTLGILNRARIGVFGITAGSPDSVPDMTTLARGTRTYSPPGGVSCGGDPEQRLPAGAPLVCSQDGDFSTIIGRVLGELTDRQDVQLRAHNVTPVLRHLDGTRLLGLDVKRANRAPFTATVSCAGVAPGVYPQDVEALLRGYRVGLTRITVTCLAAQAASPPTVLPPPVAPVHAGIQPPVAPPPPPPAGQPQAQPQTNLNPLTAGVTQEQQELQVALALNHATEERSAELEQLALVDRRKREQVQAFGLLLFAMTTCAALGLARLRARPEVAARRAR